MAEVALKGKYQVCENGIFVEYNTNYTARQMCGITPPLRQFIFAAGGNLC